MERTNGYEHHCDHRLGALGRVVAHFVDDRRWHRDRARRNRQLDGEMKASFGAAGGGRTNHFLEREDPMPGWLRQLRAQQAAQATMGDLVPPATTEPALPDVTGPVTMQHVE